MAVRAVAIPRVGFIQGGSLIGADFNSTSDQAILLRSPTPKFLIFRHYVINPSTSLTTAQGSLYLATGKNGLINATTTPYTTAQVSTIDTANNASGTAVSNNILTDNTTIYFSLTTAQGAAATADIYVFIIPLYGA